VPYRYQYRHFFLLASCFARSGYSNQCCRRSLSGSRSDQKETDSTRSGSSTLVQTLYALLMLRCEEFIVAEIKYWMNAMVVTWSCSVHGSPVVLTRSLHKKQPFHRFFLLLYTVQHKNLGIKLLHYRYLKAYGTCSYTHTYLELEMYVSIITWFGVNTDSYQ
jgi:hypothetical protein